MALSTNILSKQKNIIYELCIKIMDISIFGFKLNVEILILIGVIYLVLVGHTICGCSRVGLMEGLEVMKDAVQTATTPAPPVPAGGSKPGKATGAAGKEGFAGANTNYGESSVYDLSVDDSINTASWSAPNLTVVKGQPLSAGVKDFLAREQQPLPLADGEMDFLANVPFKPQCCPNTYSNSTGCACMTSKDYNYLMTRGGNNVPYSEY
jgi:hypothetical protein